MAAEPADRDLAVMLSRAGHELTGRLTAALAELGLTQRSQCVLVHALERERTQAELAGLADLDKTTMVATVDALEQAGLAHRVPSAADRRARIISVTDAGREAAAAGQRIVDQVHGTVLAGLSERDRSIFLGALRRLTEGELGSEPSRDGAARRRRLSSR